ncbi:conserved hypothetical protein, partial [Listeria seeligeri FSL S4-171]
MTNSQISGFLRTSQFLAKSIIAVNNKAKYKIIIGINNAICVLSIVFTSFYCYTYCITV